MVKPWSWQGGRPQRSEHQKQALRWPGNVTCRSCLCVVWCPTPKARAAVAYIVGGPRQAIFSVLAGNQFVIASCHASLHFLQRIVETLVVFPCHGGHHADGNGAVRDYHHVGVVWLVHVETRDKLAHAYATRQHLPLSVFAVWQWCFGLVLGVEQRESSLSLRSTHENGSMSQRALGQAVFHQNWHSPDRL